ncbi:MAG: sigma-70 family RNA polymerase sigma factor [Burkholderiales bacterium]|nr:sigma-70 family RNA polymerase sigma factor [Burkholderiales bacterium]
MNVARTTPDAGPERGPSQEGDGGLDRDPVDDEGAADDAAARVPPATGTGMRSVADAQLAAWIEAIADRDERALAALYDATFTRLFGLVQRIVRNAALAEEVVEDAYFQVWRQAVRFDPARGAALAWLLAMARSRAIDALRREARFEHDVLGEADDLPDAGCAAPCDELLDLARHHADLHQALMRLGAQPRQLVSMSFFRGLSHEEIAAHMELPLGTVKSQIRRALLALREVLGDRDLRLLAS